MIKIWIDYMMRKRWLLLPCAVAIGLSLIIHVDNSIAEISQPTSSVTNNTKTVYSQVPALAQTKVLFINGDNSLTKSRSVTLNIDYTNDAVSMQFSTNGSNWGSWTAFKATTSFTLPSGDGIKTVYVRFKNSSSNISLVYSDDIILDTIKPTGAISINAGAFGTNSARVTITLYPHDSGSGVASYCLGNTVMKNCTIWTDFDANVTGVDWTLNSAKDGAKTVYAMFKDMAGNISAPIKDSTKLDSTLPTGTVKINKGDAQTSSASVTLTLTAKDGSGSGVVSMIYSTDGTVWSSPEKFTVSKPISLPYGDGLKTVLVKFIDKTGNISVAYSASIILDTTVPTADMRINNDNTYTENVIVTLRLTASDSDTGSGISQVRYGNNASTWGRWENFSATKKYRLSKGDGFKTVYAQVKDKAGNISSIFSDDIIIDTTPPSGWIKISNVDQDQQTNSPDVTLQLAVADNNPGISMRFSNNGSDWSNWEDFAPDKAWNLAHGSDGVKTVYARFKDAAGNISAIVKDTIILDTKAPALTITTSPFTTSMTSKELAGTKESGSTVSIRLNDTPLDDSLITQSFVGTSWKARVGTFTEGSNTISVTATDAAFNETVKNLVITYKPFTSSDLQGDWYFVSSGFESSIGASWTKYGSITVDDINEFSGNYSDGASNKVMEGNLAINNNGTISGDVTIQDSTRTIINGRMNEKRSMFTIQIGDEMMTLVKKGDDFQRSDLAGKWYIYGVSTSPDLYSSGERGVMTFNSYGNITSGSLTNISNGQGTITTKYTLSGNSSVFDNGGLSGAIKLTYKSDVSSGTYSGQMSTRKNIAVIHSSVNVDSIDIDSKMALVKDGGTFDLSDLDGKWRFEGIYNERNNGEVYYGYLDITSGKVIDGVINGENLVAGTRFSITSSGVVTGDLRTSNGNKYSITTGKLDSNKEIMVLISGVSLIIGYVER